MSNEPNDPEARPQMDAGHVGGFVWILEKESNLLCCELYELQTGGWEMRVFEDGRLCFTQCWALEGPARFFATSLKRERVRHGWSELPPTVARHAKPTPIMDDLALLARSDCVYLLQFRSQLNDALNVLGASMGYNLIDMDALPATDARRGYPSPTLLWRGKDIFGMPVPTPPFRSC